MTTPCFKSASFPVNPRLAELGNPHSSLATNGPDTPPSMPEALVRRLENTLFFS